MSKINLQYSLEANMFNNLIWGMVVIYGIIATFYTMLANYEVDRILSLIGIVIFAFIAFLTSGKYKIFRLARDE